MRAQIPICAYLHACIYILSLFQFFAQVDNHFEIERKSISMHEHLLISSDGDIYIHECLKHFALCRLFSMAARVSLHYKPHEHYKRSKKNVKLYFHNGNFQQNLIHIFQSISSFTLFISHSRYN